ncbi:MAG: ABC transporter ATP-binding protein [Treponema sp.]|nr:ABC transporter ATP-binding protein [Treponema sp.]
MISLQNVSKTYPMGKLNVHALRGINLDFTAGDFISVAGPSGSGKTTMMNIIGLIDRPSGGELIIDGKKCTGLKRKALTQMRQEYIGFVFQSFNLLPVLTVFENVELPLVIGRRKESKKERREWVEHLVEEVGLSDRRNHVPAELSGGQQQRVAIARALVTRPKIIIADEPTANLDSVNGERILSLMKRVNRDEGTTFIFSTHDPDIWEMATHVVFLRDGEVESEQRKTGEAALPGKDGTVFRSPQERRLPS